MQKSNDGILRMKPSVRQAEALKYLFDKVTKYILYGGGAGGGKTWLSCEWLLFMAMCFPRTRWFVGRNELKKLRDSWLQTFYKVLRHHGFDPDLVFKFNGQDNFLQFENGSRIDLLDLKYEPSDPFFERLGSTEYTGGVVEEASEVDHMAFDILKSRIGRCLNDLYDLLPKILLLCNPKRNWLYTEFVKPWIDGTLPAYMKFVQALVTDNPFVDRHYFDSLSSISDKTMKARLLDGDWEYSEDENALIEPLAVNDIFSRHVSAKVNPGMNYITCDIARMGKDSTVAIEWSGMRAEKIHIWEKQGILESAKKIKLIAINRGVSMSKIIVDSDGVGGGVADILYGCAQFVNNAKPIKTLKQVQNFNNLKSQCYFKLSEMINNRELYINIDNIDLKNKIAEELEQIKCADPDGDGKLSVMRKKDVKKILGRSPDLTDALMMRMLPLLSRPRGLTIA